MRLALFLLMVISGLGVGLLASMFSSSTEGLILLLALALLIVSGLIIFIRYRRYGGNDSLLLFSLFFAFYNGPFLLQVSLGLSKGIPPSPRFPVDFAPETYLKAALASFLAAIALFISTLFLELTPKRNQAKVINGSIPRPWIGIMLTNDKLYDIYRSAMEVKLHKGARTTLKVREEIRNSPLSVYALSKKYNLSWNTARDDIYGKSFSLNNLSPTLTREDDEIILFERKQKKLFSLDDSFER